MLLAAPGRGRRFENDGRQLPRRNDYIIPRWPRNKRRARVPGRGGVARIRRGRKTPAELDAVLGDGVPTLDDLPKLVTWPDT